MKRVFTILLALSFGWLASCSGSKNAVSPELRKELDGYKNAITNQQKEIADLKKQMDSGAQGDLQSTLNALQNDVNTNKTDIRRTRSALSTIQSAVEDIRKASPLIDSTNRILLDDIQLMKSQLNELNAKMGGSSSFSSSRSGSSSSSGTRALSPQEFRAAYVNTLSKWQNGRYAEARAGFADLIRSNPNDDLADNAQYWIGESYYKEGKYEKAIVEFEKVFTYSDRGKYDDAQFKLGLCYRKMGNTRKARDEFERLINYYGDSEYKAQAQNILSKLR